MQARYEYGARGDQPAVTLTWYQGTNKPEHLDARRDPAVGQRRAVRRRQGHAAVRLRQARAAAGERASRTSRRRRSRSRSRSAITPSGSTPARPARRRRATSSTRAGSPRRTTSATSPSAPARSSSGTPRRCVRPTRPTPIGSSAAPTALVGSLAELGDWGTGRLGDWATGRLGECSFGVCRQVRLKPDTTFAV